MFLCIFALHFSVKISYVVYFFGNRTAIAAQYCENLPKGDLGCRACCHLNKTLKKLDNGNSNSPIPQQQNQQRIEWFMLDELNKLSLCEFSLSVMAPKQVGLPAIVYCPIDSPPPELV